MKNKSPWKWTPDEVASKLDEIGLGKYSDIFRINRITGKMIYFISTDELSDIGMTVVQRKIYQSWIESLPLLKKKNNVHPNNKFFTIDKSNNIKRPHCLLGNNFYRYTSDNPNNGRKKKVNNRVESDLQFLVSSGTNKSEDHLVLDEEFFEYESTKRIPCRFCKRNFAEDRVKTHENACLLSSKVVRKVFNSQKQRMSAEAMNPYRIQQKLNKGKGLMNNEVSVKSYRVEHEKLISSIRLAKGQLGFTQAHSEFDLDKRIECPYCSRKFGPENANKHINSCNVGKMMRPPMYC